MSDPYFIGCHAILAGVGHEVLDSGLSGELEVIFDEQLIFGPRVKMWYPLIKAGLATRQESDLSRLATALPFEPIFRNDEKHLPLQAADVLAWLCRMAFSGERNEFDWIVTELQPLIPFSVYSALFTAERMQRIHGMSLEMHFPPELISQWQKDLGIEPPRRRKNKRKDNLSTS